MAEKDRKRSIDGGDHDEAEDGERASKSQKAIRLLREVTTLLTESVNEGEAKESREEPSKRLSQHFQPIQDISCRAHVHFSTAKTSIVEAKATWCVLSAQGNLDA